MNNDMVQNVSVYLPADYNEAKNTYYPVIYRTTQYGYSNEDVRTMYEYIYYSMDYSDAILVSIAQTYCDLPMIPFMNSPLTGNWEDFLVHDVVPFIDDNYRTIQTAAARCVISFSSLSPAITHPDVFQVVLGLHLNVFNPEGSELLYHEIPVLVNAYLESQARLEAEIATLSTTEEIRNAYRAEIAYMWEYKFQASLFYGMGLLIAPNASREGIYFDFPYYKNGTDYVAIEPLKNTWDNGIVNLSKMVNTHQAVLQTLDIGILYTNASDTSPNWRWNQDGNEYLCALMDGTGITYTKIDYPNDITNVRIVNTDYILPFCSAHLEPKFTQESSISGYPGSIFGAGLIISLISLISFQTRKRNSM